MKGIVVELNNNKAVILTDEGLFEEISNQCYEIGQSIIIKEKKHFVSKLTAGAAGLAAAFALCTAGAYAYYTPTDYVSLDVNPSVVYTVNRFERILDAEAANDDGSEILAELQLKNKSIEEAIKETLEQLLYEGYLGKDPDSGVVISTSNKKMDEAERLAATLEQEIRNFLKNKDGIMPKVSVETLKPEQVAEAKELGVSAGKLNLVEKLAASTSGAINREEWLDKSVKELNKAIKENRKTSEKKNDNREQNGSRNNGQGDSLNGRPDEKERTEGNKDGSGGRNDGKNSVKKEQQVSGEKTDQSRSLENPKKEYRNQDEEEQDRSSGSNEMSADQDGQKNSDHSKNSRNKNKKDGKNKDIE